MEKTEMMIEYEIKIDSIVNWDCMPIGYAKYLESELIKARAKAEAYDRLMSGGKKTPKEVANFFGKPIAMDMDGEWRVFYDCIPTIKGCCWTPTEMYEYDVIPSILIDFTGDWKDSLTLPDGWEEK